MFWGIIILLGFLQIKSGFNIYFTGIMLFLFYLKMTEKKNDEEKPEAYEVYGVAKQNGSDDPNSTWYKPRYTEPDQKPKKKRGL